MAIRRTLPRSSESRFNALTAAKLKKDSAAGSLPITAATAARLDTIVTLFGTGRNFVSVKRAESVLSTSQKDVLVENMAMLDSHYLQVLNMHIAQGIFPAAYRAYYKLDTNNTSLPPLKTESDINAVAQAIIDGEPNMVAAGGIAIPFPAKAKMQAALTALLAKQNEQSNKKDITDKAEEDLAKLNTEADAVIKKVWDEVETFWNEEPIESMRKKAREWGLVYVSDEKPALLSGIVKDKDTAAPVEGATLTIISSDEATVTDATGAFTLKTGTDEAQVLRIEKAGYITKDMNLTIVLGVDMVIGDVELEKVV